MAATKRSTTIRRVLGVGAVVAGLVAGAWAVVSVVYLNELKELGGTDGCALSSGPNDACREGLQWFAAIPFFAAALILLILGAYLIVTRDFSWYDDYRESQTPHP